MPRVPIQSCAIASLVSASLDPVAGPGHAGGESPATAARAEAPQRPARWRADGLAIGGLILAGRARPWVIGIVVLFMFLGRPGLAGEPN